MSSSRLSVRLRDAEAAVAVGRRHVAIYELILGRRDKRIRMLLFETAGCIFIMLGAFASCVIVVLFEDVPPAVPVISAALADIASGTGAASTWKRRGALVDSLDEIKIAIADLEAKYAHGVARAEALRDEAAAAARARAEEDHEMQDGRMELFFRLFDNASRFFSDRVRAQIREVREDLTGDEPITIARHDIEVDFSAPDRHMLEGEGDEDEDDE